MRWIAALAFAFALDGATVPEVVRAVRSEVRPDEAMEYMRRIYSTDRWFTFPKFQETAEYVRGVMNRNGMRNIEIIGAPADGVTQVGFWTEPLAWDVKSARLELLDDAHTVLADYEKVPSSLVMWSGSTAPGGITAEIIELKNIDQQDLRGKLVMTRENPAGMKWKLARKGALGAINTFTENPKLLDGRQWINAWGDNGWAFTKGSAPLLGFSITPRQAEYVRKLLAQGRPVRAHAVVDTRYYSGKYPYTTGIVQGTGPEEVLALGHVAEQGAGDNATGASAILEAAAALNRLIAAGKLPKPRRSIRLMLMGEMYGSMHYIQTYPDRVKHTVAAICIDTPAASYDLPGTEYTFYMNPHVAKSYTDALILRVAKEYFPTVNRPWHEKPFMTGTDTYISEPMVDIPVVWPYSGSGVETHHNSEDTPDRVDPRSLRDVTIVTASYLYYIANAGDAEAVWLAKLARDRGKEQIAKAAPDKLAYATAREKHSVLSTARLAPVMRSRIEAIAATLGNPPAMPPAEGPSWVVHRKRFGTIPLDELAPDQREGFPSGAWATAPITALYWCDGVRSIAEVMRLTRMELGNNLKLDLPGYFQFLQRHGYVDITSNRR